MAGQGHGSGNGETTRGGREEAFGPLRRPAGVGALLGCGWLLALVLPWEFDDLCRSDEPWGCLGFGLVLLAAVPVVGTLLGWALLRAVGVRPAWRVAAVGGLLGVVAAALFFRAGAGGVWAVLAMPLVLAAAYAAAAAVALPGVGTPRRWAVLAAVLVLLWPLTGALATYRVSEGRARELAASPVPLLAPDLNGYRLYFASAGKYSGAFSYLLLPKSVQPGAADRQERGVWVKVAPQVAGFAPPAACEIETVNGRQDVAPCEQVAADTWRSSTNGYSHYIVRREGAIVVLSTQGPSVSDGDLRAFATSLKARRPGFFLDE